MCNYRFVFSHEAQTGDVIAVKFTSLINSDVTFAVGTKLDDASGELLSLPEGKQIYFLYPYTLLLTVMNSYKEGSFTISSKLIKQGSN